MLVLKLISTLNRISLYFNRKSLAVQEKAIASQVTELESSCTAVDTAFDIAEERMASAHAIRRKLEKRAAKKLEVDLESANQRKLDADKAIKAIKDI